MSFFNYRTNASELTTRICKGLSPMGGGIRCHLVEAHLKFLSASEAAPLALIALFPSMIGFDNIHPISCYFFSRLHTEWKRRLIEGSCVSRERFRQKKWRISSPDQHHAALYRLIEPFHSKHPWFDASTYLDILAYHGDRSGNIFFKTSPSRQILRASNWAICVKTKLNSFDSVFVFVLTGL